MKNIILTIDVGNSNIVIAGMENGMPVFADRLPTGEDWSEGQMEQALRSILERHGQDPRCIRGGILSSVVPSKNKALQAAFTALTGQCLLEGRAKLPLSGYTGGAPGQDRLVDLIAARAICGAPVAVFDLGTCTTLSVMDAEGAFAGGMICAGIQLSLDAEAERAEQLPALCAGAPAHLIGRNTAECMLSGAVIGQAAMIDGLIERLERDFSPALRVVLTGGLGRLVLPWLRRPVCYEPDLQLKGLALLYEMGCGQKAE